LPTTTTDDADGPRPSADDADVENSEESKELDTTGAV